MTSSLLSPNRAVRHGRTIAILALALSAHAAFATTHTVANATALTAAITASVDGDTIRFTENVVVTAELGVSKSLVFNGNNFTVSVQTPGLNEAGALATGASTYRVLNISGANKTVTVNDLTIIGGSISGNGGAITLAAGNVLKLNNSVVTKSRASAGGGINNAGGVIYLHNSEVIRNAANYGGGFFNTNSGKMFIDKSTFSENRSTSLSGGGGAGENNGSGVLYINNSTFSNNKSTEIGGAINNYSSTIYAMNSSFTGNVAFGNFQGGAIGNNGGTVRAVNCLFAYNYRRSGGSVTNPTAYVLDDMNAYSNAAGISLYYCITHSTALTGINQVIGNIAYTGAIDGSDNTIFSGGALTKITDASGVEIGTAMVYQPFLYNNGGGVAPTLKVGSFTLQPGNRGTQVGYHHTNNVNPVVGYYDQGTSTWINLTGSNASSNTVTDDQLGATRSTPPAIGNLESTTGTLYMLKVNSVSGGTVNGATIYGDVYPENTNVSITALPAAGQEFVRWDYAAGGPASTANPFTMTMTQNRTYVPVFQASSAGTYTIAYAANGANSGEAPAASSQNTATNIANSNTMQRSGYDFNGWNTAPNGSGTHYNAGDLYSAGNNLTLYAEWGAQPLDITLISFSARNEGTAVALQWQTAKEEGIRFHQTERSANGAQFGAIGGEVTSRTGAGTQTYIAYDRSPVAGISYYRIRTVHSNGTVSYSPVRAVTVIAPMPAVKAYPNPAHGVLNITGPALSIARLLSAEGLVVAELALDAQGQGTISAGNVAAGVYFLRVVDATGRIIATQRVSVLH